MSAAALLTAGWGLGSQLCSIHCLISYKHHSHQVLLLLLLRP
jgi:hypothetical protein